LKVSGCGLYRYATGAESFGLAFNDKAVQAGSVCQGKACFDKTVAVEFGFPLDMVKVTYHSMFKFLCLIFENIDRSRLMVDSYRYVEPDCLAENR